MNRVFKGLRTLSLNCREAAQLISEANERRLSSLERLGLKLHLPICSACRAYRHSIAFLEQSMRSAGQTPQEPSGEILSDAAKARIRQKIESS